MTEGRELAPRATLPSAPANDDAAEEAQAPGEARVGEVFQRDPPGPPMPWRQRSFLAPVVTVLWMSTALVYGMILLLSLLWAWVR